MTKLTITRGVSGSGKSTWAHNQLGVVVSRDAIRLAQDVESYADVDENLVTAQEDASVRHLLRAGKDVVVDDTNITWAYVVRLAQIGYDEGADVELKVFDVPLDNCIKNNDRRAAMGGRDVPHDVIRKQYERFKSNKNKQLSPPLDYQPYSGTPGKPKAFLVDLDGTLANFNNVRGPYDTNVEDDEAFQVIVDIVVALELAGYQPIFMSGRKEAAREGTVRWLIKHVTFPDFLFMRADDDNRKDNLVKYDLFNENVRDRFDVQFVLDDRDQVVRMWRRLGLTCLQVAEGAF